jgi:excisionase family DNA binding protein
MTIPAFAKPLGGRLPSADERIAANQLRKILAIHSSRGSTQKLELVDVNQQIAEVVLTPGLSQLLIELLRHVGSGKAVTLVPVSEMLTTQQAADILNVSRPYLISLLEKGLLEFELVGRHRRIPAAKLFDYKDARDSRRRQTLAELAAMDAELL